MGHIKYSHLILLSIFFTLSCASRPAASLHHESPRLRSETEAFGHDYAIATQGHWTSKIAEQIFEKGGNIYDAAAAASFAISVERPQSTGLGGGGFLLSYNAKEKQFYALDFRERAPLAATRDMYLDKKGNVIPKSSINGPLAAAVPGLVDGVLRFHEKFGKLTRQEVMQPAIDLANKGFKIYPYLAKMLKRREKTLQLYPASRKKFFKHDDSILKEGDVLKQPDLARTLQSISDKGREGFYKGWVANAISKASKSYGGILTKKDLVNYQSTERQALQTKYKDYQVISMPPPSSGGIHILQMLNILENKQLDKEKPFSPHNIHLISSSMQLAFADRAKHLGDPDFYKVPSQQLISKSYAKDLARKIDKNSSKSSTDIHAGKFSVTESNDTTHFTLMDGEGNVVVSTQTINGPLGSGFVADGTGVLLNNEMDDFSAKPGTPNMFGAIGAEANSIQAKKRPLSSMSPTIVMKDHKPVLALGSPNGTRIITCVLLSTLNYIEFGMPLFESITALRYHHQWLPDEIRVDKPFLPLKTKQSLEKMGYKIANKPYGCRVQAISFEKNRLHVVSDPRGEGRAIAK